MASIIQIQLRRDTAANWTAQNPVLAQGEPALETDTNRLKFGDGTTAYNSLAYFDNDKTLNFVQGVADANWIISHNLGKFPSVSVFDSAGTPLKGQVEHTSTNQLKINFNKPISGKAYLN